MFSWHVMDAVVILDEVCAHQTCLLRVRTHLGQLEHGILGEVGEEVPVSPDDQDKHNINTY